jgi:CheY-like chemotaxis protein
MQPFLEAAMTLPLVLNVDDYDAARYAKTRILKNAGYRVHEARSGKEALDMIERVHPNLVLLDVRLPDIDGRDVARRIRSNPMTADMLILQTSAAFVTDQDVMSGYESGANAYVRAPYQPSDLVATIRSLIH